MTLSRNQEEKVRRAIGVLVDTTPPGFEFEELTSTTLAPKRRPPISGWLTFATAFLLVAVLGGLVVWATLSEQSDSDTASDPASGEVVLLQDPLVVRGAESPEPLFDTSQLGTEVELSEPADIGATIVRIEEWLEDVEEDDIIKYVVAGAISTGAQAGTLETSSGRGWGLWIVPATDALPSWSGSNENEPQLLIGWHPGTDHPTEADIGLQGTFAWGPLSTEASVVTASHGDTTVWQRPVGGIAVFDITNPAQHPIVWTAYDQNGDVIETVTDLGADEPAP